MSPTVPATLLYEVETPSGEQYVDRLRCPAVSARRESPHTDAVAVHIALHHDQEPADGPNSTSRIVTRHDDSLVRKERTRRQ